MNKEYRFAVAKYDETSGKVICPCCDSVLSELETVVKMPINNALTWICAGCAVKKAADDGMFDFRFDANHLLCYGERTCAAHEIEFVELLAEVCRR